MLSAEERRQKKAPRKFDPDTHLANMKFEASIWRTPYDGSLTPNKRPKSMFMHRLIGCKLRSLEIGLGYFLDPDKRDLNIHEFGRRHSDEKIYFTKTIVGAEEYIEDYLLKATARATELVQNHYISKLLEDNGYEWEIKWTFTPPYETIREMNKVFQRNCRYFYIDIKD